VTTAVFDDDAFVMPSFVGSFLVHVALLIATAAAVTPLRVVVDDAPPDDRRYPFASQPFGWAVESDGSTQTAPTDAEQFGVFGLPGSTDEGAMGDFVAPWVDHHYGVRGPPDNPDAHIARTSGFLDAAVLSGIGLESYSFGDPHAPIAPWGREDSLGEDPESARGHFGGVAIGAAASSSDGIQGDGGQSGFGDGSGIPFTSYVHHCRLQ